MKRLRGLDAYDFHTFCSIAHITTDQNERNLTIYDECKKRGLWPRRMTHEQVAEIVAVVRAYDESRRLGSGPTPAAPDLARSLTSSDADDALPELVKRYRAH